MKHSMWKNFSGVLLIFAVLSGAADLHDTPGSVYVYTGGDSAQAYPTNYGRDGGAGFAASRPAQRGNIGGSAPGKSADLPGGRLRSVGPVAGLAGCAVDMDGVDDYLLVRHFKGLPSKHLSVGAWVRVTKHKSYNRIVSHKWVNDGWNLYVDGSGVARFGVGQDNIDYAASKIIFRERWHYIVGTYDGSYLQLYVDGTAGSRTILKDAVIDAEGYISIGGAEWDPFHGQLDDIKMWNYARTPEQVRREMVVQPTGNEPGLIGYWRLDDCKGSQAVDYTAYGNHAELGPARRAPRWVQSHAPVAIPCVPLSGATSIRLEGSLGDDTTPMAYLTQLPIGGTLHQVSSGGQFEAITSSPTELWSPSRRVVYQPEAGNLTGPRCDRFQYRVHDGAFTSREVAEVLVELAPDAAACDLRPLTPNGCWGERTKVSYVVPTSPPPRVSFIVPLYNQAHLLPETLESVVAQTVQGWELLIVDDGSTDDSRDVARALVRQYVARGFNMRMVEKANGGLADARNAGIRAARSEWILPLDGDDLLLPEFLATALRLLEEDPHANLVIADLKGFGAWEYSWRLPEYDPLDLRYSNMFHCSALFHRSLWEKVPGGYPTTTLFGYEDWAFWIAAEEAGGGGGIQPRYIKEEMFLYRIREDSMHQKLLSSQEFSLASLRVLYPNLYPVDLIVSSHDKFLAPTDQVVKQVAQKVHKYPHKSAVNLMQGLVSESFGRSAYDGHATGYFWEEALESYTIASHLAHYTDWQPRWRMGLLQQRMGLYEDSNATFTDLFRDFVGLEEAYNNLHLITTQVMHRGPLMRDVQPVM